MDLEQWGLWKLSDKVLNVIKEIGYDVSQLVDKLSLKDIPSSFKSDNGGTGIKGEGKTYSSFYTDSGTQTDEAVCSTCIIRQLRKFVDKGVQQKPYVGEVAIQTEREDELPIMNSIALLNPSQLIALNDFSDIIKGPSPTNATELYRLREKLVDIFNTSQRPCMMPSQFFVPKAPPFKTSSTPVQSIPNQYQHHQQQQQHHHHHHQQQQQQQMYAMQSQQNMMQQFQQFQNPIPNPQYPQMAMPPHQIYVAPQPVPAPSFNNLHIPIEGSRREDPRHREDSRHREDPRHRDDPRRRDRDRPNIPPRDQSLSRSGELKRSSSIISSKSYGRGAKRL